MKTIEQLQAEFEAIIYNNVKPLPTVEWEKPLNWFRLDYLREISVNAFNTVKDYLVHPEFFNEFIKLTAPYTGKDLLNQFYNKNCKRLTRKSSKSLIFDEYFWEYICQVWLYQVSSPDKRQGLPKSKIITWNFDSICGQKYHLDNYVLPDDSFWNPQDLIDFGFQEIRTNELSPYAKGTIYIKGGLAVNKYRFYSAECHSWRPVSIVSGNDLNRVYHPIKWIKDPRTQEKDLRAVQRAYAIWKKEQEEIQKAQEALQPKRSVAPVEVEDLHVYSRGGWDELWGD